MSHFYGRLNGAAGQATRTGSRSSGISATVRTWSGDLDTRLWHGPAAVGSEGADFANIDLRPEHRPSVALATIHYGDVLNAVGARDHRTMQAIAAVQRAFAQLDRAANAHASRKGGRVAA
jgi:hypothetical protein